MDFAANFITGFDKLIYFCVQAFIILGTLSVLVVLHEWGHFIVARMNGVRVLEFSFGMGKLLYGKKWGDTEYQFRLIPMGGFVKMAGDEWEASKQHAPNPDEFYGVSASRRLAIVFAGPFMNLILAFVALWVVFYCVGQIHTRPLVGYVDPNSIAAKAGIQSGDLIQSLNKNPVDSFETVQNTIVKNAHQKVSLKIMRGEKILDLTLIPESKDFPDLLGDMQSMGDIGIHPYVEAIVGRVMPGKPASKAGLQAGDKIIQIENTPVKFWEEMLSIIHNSPDKPLKVIWLRNENNHEAIIIPESQTVGNTSGLSKKTIGLIGIAPKFDEKMGFNKNVSLFEAMTRSVEKIGSDTWLTLRAIKKLILGQMSKDNLMGPVRLAGLVTDVAKSGFFPWLLFLGIISLQLAIFNFLPIPALDGGHAVFFIWEIMTGKMVNLRWQDRFTRVGFSMLILLFVFVVFNDVITLFKK